MHNATAKAIDWSEFGGKAVVYRTPVIALVMIDVLPEPAKLRHTAQSKVATRRPPQESVVTQRFFSLVHWHRIRKRPTAVENRLFRLV